MNPKSQQKTQRRSWLFFALICLYFASISVISHIPGDSFKQLGFNIWDKGAHFIEYMPLGALLFLGLDLRLAATVKSIALLWAVIFAASLGLIDELHQMYVPGRFSSSADLVADGLGGAAGALSVLLYRQARFRQERAHRS